MQRSRLLFYLLCGYFVLSYGIPHHRHKHGIGEDNVQTGSRCQDSFDSHLEQCLNPFSRKAHIYTTTHPQNAIVKEIFVKYVCRRYKKMLHCIHQVLTNCETLTNTEIVQQKLDERQWIVHVNKMCNIQSDPSTRKHSSDTKGLNSRHKVIPPITSLQPLSDRVYQPVTQSEIEYYNMKSHDAAENIQNSHGKNSHMHENIPYTIPKHDKGQFQKSDTKLVQPYLLTSVSSEHLPRLVTYITYNMFLNRQEDSQVSADKLKLMSMDTSRLDSTAKEGQMPVMVQLLYIDGETLRTSKQFSSLNNSLSGSSSLLISDAVIVVCLILTVISTHQTH
ncbi:uncharacterized protein LOC117336349 [Pecten maximus]|uniref:uncharacterized protein LOC117336349 n=1 Tax=Pecten maximus TaxID=6579 RepID=UPI00145916AA|nr:uncharacterized protein LOC117336349 [Pecten maximus]